MQLTPSLFISSLKWHEGPPPFFQEPTNSQSAYNSTIYDPKVVAIKDDLGNFFVVGQLNHNLCANMCPNCLKTHSIQSKFAITDRSSKLDKS